MAKLINQLVKPFAVTALLMAPATVTLTMIPTDAAAQKGGNGNGNGNGNRAERGNGNQDRAERGNRSASAGNVGNNGRGAIARELKGLNAAHASPNALANASPNSMPGKLREFRDATLAERDYDAQIADSQATYDALLQMTEERFAELNPDLNYAEALAASLANLDALKSASAGAEAERASALDALTGGRQISDAAMAELMALLSLN